MTKKLFTILIIFFSCLIGKSQSILITGKVYEYVSSKPLGDIHVGEKKFTELDSFILSDSESGYFELFIEDKASLDSIILTGLFTYKTLIIRNIPIDKDTIFLDSIPFFGRMYPEAMQMWNFACRPLDIICKIREYFYPRKLRKGLDRIEKESIQNASQAEYYFRNEKFMFEYNDKVLILDLQKPFNE